MPRCVNCSLRCANRRVYRLEEVPQPMMETLQRWIQPTQIIPDCVLCQECYNKLQHGIGDQSEPAFGHLHVCYGCGISTLRTRIHRVPVNCPERDVILRWTQPHLVNQLDHVCRACWMAAVRAVRREMEQDAGRHLELPMQIDDEELPAPHMHPAPAPAPPAPPAPPMMPQHQAAQAAREAVPTMILPNYKRAIASSRYCIFGGCIEPERMLVPLTVKERLLLDYRYYIPMSARICNYHLTGFFWNELNSELNSFTVFQVENMLQILTNANRRQIDFKNVAEMEPHLCHYWLGMSAEQFAQLLLHIPRLNVSVPCASEALSIFLIKLRTGDSNERLSTLFKLPRRTLENYLNKSRDALFEEFVPLYLGMGHMGVPEVARRNKIIPDGFFGKPNVANKPAIIICDGTYIYVQSSSNYLFQKKTYSLHKYRNLLKPFMIVCCDGYILEALGPYAATESDANIIKQEFLNPQGAMRTYFRADDVFILDRGFRDAVPVLREYGYSVHMPDSLLEGEHQLTTLQANRSRCVTMCRWVVEVVNGRIKRDFKLFRQTYFNKAATHLMTDFKIACALLNKFHPLIEDNADAEEYMRIAQNRLNMENNLAVFVQEENLNRRRAMFNVIDGNNPHLNNFPRLNIAELKKFALGTYQLKQARSYYGEHIRENGTYLIEVCDQMERYPELAANRYLIRARIRSRHVGGRTYFTYLLINNLRVVANTLEAIDSYYCNCLVGKRTVGCCAHTMTVLWYLSWARFHNVDAPATFLDNVFYGNEDD